jgi:hypothetical protein
MNKPLTFAILAVGSMISYCTFTIMKAEKEDMSIEILTDLEKSIPDTFVEDTDDEYMGELKTPSEMNYLSTVLIKVKGKKDGACIKHKVKKGDTVYSLNKNNRDMSVVNENGNPINVNDLIINKTIYICEKG